MKISSILYHIEKNWGKYTIAAFMTGFIWSQLVLTVQAHESRISALEKLDTPVKLGVIETKIDMILLTMGFKRSEIENVGKD